MKILVIPPDKPQEMTVKYRDFVGDNKTRIVRKTIRPSPHYLGRAGITVPDLPRVVRRLKRFFGLVDYDGPVNPAYPEDHEGPLNTFDSLAFCWSMATSEEKDRFHEFIDNPDTPGKSTATRPEEVPVVDESVETISADIVAEKGITNKTLRRIITDAGEPTPHRDTKKDTLIATVVAAGIPVSVLAE